MAVLAVVGDTLRAGAVGDTVRMLVVRALDREGRALADVRVTFLSDDDGQFTPSTALTDASGEARAVWRLGGTAGVQRARVAAGTLTPVTFTATAAAASPARLGLRTQPGTARVGEPLSVAPVVDVRDRFGNVVPLGTSVPITVTLANGPGTLGGTTTVTLSGDSAVFGGLELRGPVGDRLLRFEAPGLQPVVSVPVLLRPAGRSLVDRPDDLTGAQVKVVYVVPSDGMDRGLDTLPTIAYSVAVWQRWLSQRLGGRTMRLDTFAGALDVTFFRLSTTDAAMVARGAFVVTEIERQMRAAGLIQPDRVYAVYYDGGSTWSCGGAAWPPSVPGQVAAMYLRGTPPGATCPSDALRTSPLATMGYWESAMLHDIVHALGIVSRSAPNHTSATPAHVPEPTDLMYSGTSPWLAGPNLVVDVNGDDYNGPAVPAGLPTLLTSPFIASGVQELAARAVAPSPSILLRMGQDDARVPVGLPPHPPFPLGRP